MGLRTLLGLKRNFSERNINNLGFFPKLISPSQPAFPIDIVITWVDGEDPAHQKKRNLYLSEDVSKENSGSHRFKDNNELLFCIRAISMYAPWFRKIYVVTDRQRPLWFQDSDRIELVYHDQFIPDKFLPTFNSHVIASFLHHIDGLSNHFIYFNDDVLLLKPTEPSMFFSAGGLALNFLGSFEIPADPDFGKATASAVAAFNATQLIEREIGTAFMKRFSHMCFPLRKDVAFETEEVFEKEIEAFRGNKFRSSNDLLCAGYLFPAYSYYTGRSIISSSSLWYIKIKEQTAERHFRKILDLKGKDQQRLILCANDTFTKDDLRHHKANLQNFFQSYFDTMSDAEKQTMNIS